MTLSPPRSTADLLSAEQAAARLGVCKATLYAYVSRGLLTAVPDPKTPQRRRYAAFEIDRLRHGARARPRTDPAPRHTLYEGQPLVDTALTGIVDGDLVVRGRALVPWSRQASLEDAAALLWDMRPDAAFCAPAPTLPDVWHRTAEALRDSDPAARAVALWALAMPWLNGGAHLQGNELATALGQHLRVAFACWLAQPPSDAPLHLQVALAWGLPGDGHDALRQALVLGVDMMTNLMGLAGRMMASVQGSLAACQLSSLSYGFVRLSGGEFEAVESLFDEVQAIGSLPAVAASYRARGEALPGFNHYLFVHGDPRAAELLRRARTLSADVAGWLPAEPLSDPMHPTLDFGMVALRRALKAPRHAALALTHMARSAGTLAQALEQRQVGRRMWVQSRYVGPLQPPPGLRPSAGV